VVSYMCWRSCLHPLPHRHCCTLWCSCRQAMPCMYAVLRSACGCGMHEQHMHCHDLAAADDRLTCPIMAHADVGYLSQHVCSTVAGSLQRNAWCGCESGAAVTCQPGQP
jgi:hypothetical protein